MKYLSISQCHLKSIRINDSFPQLETLVVDGNEFSKVRIFDSKTALLNFKNLVGRCPRFGITSEFEEIDFEMFDPWRMWC